MARHVIAHASSTSCCSTAGSVVSAAPAQIYPDPLTGKAEWGLARAGGRIVGVHSLSDRQPHKEDGFDADDQRFRGRAPLSRLGVPVSG